MIIMFLMGIFAAFSAQISVLSFSVHGLNRAINNTPIEAMYQSVIIYEGEVYFDKSKFENAINYYYDFALNKYVKEKAVKIVGIRTYYALMEHRINIIGTAFEAAHCKSSCFKRSKNPTDYGSLAAAAVSAAYKYSFHRRFIFIIHMGFSAFSIVCLPTFRVRVTAI